MKPLAPSVDAKPLVLTDSALPIGAVWEAVSSLTSSPPAELGINPPERVKEEAQVEAPVESAPVVEEETNVVEAILESVEEQVEKAIEVAEEAVDEGIFLILQKLINYRFKSAKW